MSANLDGMQPWLVPYAQWLLSAMERYGDGPQVTSVYRSPQKQAWLYDRFLKGLNKYPVAPPGRSYHEYGRAFDVVLRSKRYALWGAVWKAMGGQWFPSDEIHFQA
jgi:LAS superfamily LD-carboxypeptidase LdcB